MNILLYINKEFWCSFKNNNRTLFERSLWIMGAAKYKNKVIKKRRKNKLKYICKSREWF